MTVRSESSPPALSPADVRRYGRHLALPEIGLDGQRRLRAASVLCIGAGGLGSPAALYLAAAGVGRLGLVDFDAVDESNLQRQVLHGTADVGRAKVVSARDRLVDLNPGIQVEAHGVRLTAQNAFRLLDAYDVVVDGSDNFPARYLVNDASVLRGRPYVYGSVFRCEGQAAVLASPGGPCYRCLHPEPPAPGLVPSCADDGVLGVVPGVIGTIQATEAIKLLLGIGEPLVGRLLHYDALAMRFRELSLRRDPQCPACGTHPVISDLAEVGSACGSADRQGRADEVPGMEITVDQLKARLDAGEDVQLLDVREPHETFICNLSHASTLIPMREIPHRLGELDRDREVVVYCRSGARSLQVVGYLRRQGFARAVNLRGGMLEWIDRVDPTQTKY